MVMLNQDSCAASNLVPEMSRMPSVTIAGVCVTACPSLDAALGFLFPPGKVRPDPGYVIAVNPEKVMAAMRDIGVRDILNSATMRIPDGIGVVWAMRRRTRALITRIAGYDLWEALMAEAGRRRAPVYLLGARSDVVDAVRDRLRREYDVHIAGHRDGYFSPSERFEVMANIAKARPAIVCVAMGSPRQEQFIKECRAHAPEPLYMGVGGSFDVFAGRVRRAPNWVQSLNLEWAYRVMQEPTVARARRLIPVAKFAWLNLVGRL